MTSKSKHANKSVAVKEISKVPCDSQSNLLNITCPLCMHLTFHIEIDESFWTS